MFGDGGERISRQIFEIFIKRDLKINNIAFYFNFY
jgi:hypothetical protein